MSSYTTAIVSPHLPGSFTKLVRARKTFIFRFPNQKQRNVWDAISRSNSICPENIVFDGSQCIVNDRNFKMRRRRESQISNSFTRQNNLACASRFFLNISLPSTARLPVKMPNFTFCEGRKQAMTKFILFMKLDIKKSESVLAFDKVSELK